MKGRSIVKNNGHNSALHIIDTGDNILASITVVEKGIQVLNRRIHPTIKEGKIIGSVRDMLYMDYKVNQVLPGHVVVKQSIEPPYPDDPTEKLLWRDGVVVRTSQGDCVWETTYYTEDENDQDVIII